jgi:hypothetical protein
MAPTTIPTAGNGGQTATTPMSAGFAAGAPSGETVAAVVAGIATQYWNECVAYPPGDTASLWLFVDNSWRNHDNPSASTQDMVQRAFLGTGSTVRVWYDGAKVVGLVVSG